MAPLVGVLDPTVVLPTLPQLAVPTFRSAVHVATRGPHPVKDPPDCRRPRRTGFLVLTPRDQAACAATMRQVVDALDRASRAAGAGPFPHPEPDRFFHLSVWNNRGGDAMRSIGDIGPADLRT